MCNFLLFFSPDALTPLILSLLTCQRGSQKTNKMGVGEDIRKNTQDNEMESLPAHYINTKDYGGHIFFWKVYQTVL